MSRLLPPLLLAFAGLLACPKPSPTPEPDQGSTVPGGAVDPGPAPDGSAPATCLRDADCGGGVCEGQGCSDDQPGTCAPEGRMCTRDSRPYCGCDGQTFRSSGTCPGRRFAHEGECASEGQTPGADGSPCLAASDCQSGICEGQGCGDDQPGECKPAARPCTRDLRPYCGCDGQTFRSSGSCPGQRYSAPGECTTAGTGDGSKKKGGVSDAKAP
jgi:hypothetical protein